MYKGEDETLPENYRPISLLSIYNRIFEKLLYHRTDKVYTATSRKVVGKNVHATIPKGNMGYDQYTVPDTIAVKTSFVAFL